MPDYSKFVKLNQVYEIGSATLNWFSPTKRPPPPKFKTNIHSSSYVLEFARWIWIFSDNTPLMFLNSFSKNIFAKISQSTPTPQIML